MPSLAPVGSGCPEIHAAFAITITVSTLPATIKLRRLWANTLDCTHSHERWYESE